MKNLTRIPSRLQLVAMSMCAFVDLASAGPISVIPWNGHQGAASFTFDDDCQSQLDNLVPALKSRKVHATFFLYDVGGAFTNNKAAWISAARDGNELANHSVDHADFSKAIDANAQVSGMATRLRSADPIIQAVTFAYPYCAIGYESAVGAENIIGRGCLFAAPYQPLQWNNPPSDWNNVGAIYVSDDANAAGPTLQAIDAAKNGGWISTLNHGVGGDWATVSTANVLAMIDRAIANGLWIGTYQEVAAYWRAGLAMAQAATTKTDSGWTVAWVSPHPKMPTSVPLRIRFDAATFGKEISVYQKGIAVPAQADSSYVVDFMNLGVVVKNRPTIAVPARRDTIFNGSFGSGAIGWSFNVWGGGGQGRVVDGEYKIAIDSVGTHNSDIQVVQNGIILVQGKTYQVKFDAYSTNNRTLEANVEKDDSPWTSYLPAFQSFDLTTSKTNYSYTFTMTNPTDSNGRVSFNAGASTGTVFIDDVSIKSIEIPSSIASGRGVVGGGAVVRLDKFRLNVEFCAALGARVSVGLFDSKGAVVRSNSLQADGIIQSLEFDLSGLPRGVYVLGIDAAGKSILRSKVLVGN